MQGAVAEASKDNHASDLAIQAVGNMATLKEMNCEIMDGNVKWFHCQSNKRTILFPYTISKSEKDTFQDWAGKVVAEDATVIHFHVAEDATDPVIPLSWV